MRFKAKGKDVIQGGEGYQLREESAHSKAHFVAENDIGPENSYFRDVSTEYSTPYHGRPPMRTRTRDTA
jgi:hypothetical protein